MNNLNSVLLEGRLVDDPKTTTFPQSNNALCKMSVANNRYYKKDGEQVHEVSYFMIDVWGNTGENCVKYLKKGSGVRVVGRLKQDRWKDKNDSNRQSIKIIAEHVDFFPSKAQGDASNTYVQKDSAKKDSTEKAVSSKTEEVIPDSEIISL